MTLLLGVSTLKTLLEDNDLLVSLVSDKTSSNRYTEAASASGEDLDLASASLSSHEDIRERDLVAWITLDGIDRDLRSRANLVLLARCANYREYLRLFNYCSFFFLCHTAYTFTGYNFTGSKIICFKKPTGVLSASVFSALSSSALFSGSLP